MRPFPSRIIGHLRFRAAAYSVLVIALVPTLIAYWRVETNVQARDRDRFDALASEGETLIRDNLNRLVVDLFAVRGFFEASTNVSPDEWRAFVSRLELDRRHPGIRSVGFSEKVSAAQSAAFVERMRKQAGPAYDIFPPPVFPVAFPTVHVTQFPTNIDSRLGWDSYTEANRRSALDGLMETGRPAVSAKVAFWNADGRETYGFTIFVPIQQNIMDRTNAPDVRGVVFSSFIPQHLFNTLSNTELLKALSLELFDGTSRDPTKQLGFFTGGPSTHEPKFEKDVPIRLLNRVFLLRVTSLPEFETTSEGNLPIATLACGIGFSFLLFGITWLQGSARSAADRLNRRLRESEEQLRAANAELERKVLEAKQTEGMLAHERDLLGTLLDHSPDRIYFKDLESRFIKCGKAVLDRLGQAARIDAVGKSDFDLFTEEHARPAFELEQKIIQTGRAAIGLVEKETWQDGHESWVLTSKMPLRDKHGNIIGTFGISKDITELKLTEIALAKEKELLAVTLRSIGEGVITTDVGGRIVLFNHVAEQVTGWAQAEAVGQPLTEVFRTNNGIEGEVLRQVPGDTAQITRDAVLFTRSGTERSISQSVAPIIDLDGNKLGAVLVFRDITEKLKTEAELLKASKLESIGVLAGGIAHDFNNILTVILGNISLARMAHAAGMSMSESLEEAEKASMRARELTQRLLTFAKGGAPIKRPISLAPLVRECVVNALRDAAVTPEFFLGDALWPVEADESQIAQVLQNLIGHARASIKQDPRLDIHVFNQEIASDPLLLLKPGRYVRVSIRDYGSGIQPENLTKIFEPYFGSKKQGSGLELATAYSIVRKHEGQIRVESISGQGTIFHIYLPATQAPVSAVACAPQTARSRPGFAARRVLVMDDELSIRKLAVLLLEKLGCTAVTAVDGAEAIASYEAARKNGEPFDVVIMDLTIPNGMGGKETMRQLRALDPNVVAIVSSGYSNDPVMANFRDYGFSGVVPKPYSSDDLAAALGDLFAANGMA